MPTSNLISLNFIWEMVFHTITYSPQWHSEYKHITAVLIILRYQGCINTKLSKLYVTELNEDYTGVILITVIIVPYISSFVAKFANRSKANLNHSILLATTYLKLLMLKMTLKNMRANAEKIHFTTVYDLDQ